LAKSSDRNPVVVAQANRAQYLAGFLAAIASKRPVVLANPQWGESERAQAAAQIQPGVWLGEKSTRWPKMKSPKFAAKTWAGRIFIPTGGTGGRVRWAIHTWATLATAAHALADFLDAARCTHVSTLPPWHVSGLMPAVRALETQGTLRLEDWKSLEGGRAPGIPPETAIISLVPTQLERLLKRKAVLAWLRNTRAVLLGGAAAQSALLKRARALRLPIALAYGMTETAAAVALQTPEDFLAGKTPWLTPLPHARIWVGDEADHTLPKGKSGRIWIEASSLCQGYFPVRRKPGPFGAEDIGKSDKRGRLSVLGRTDRVINTGGEKVDPTELEKQIRATGWVDEVRVVGLPDMVWGERVVAIYSGKKRNAKEWRKALQGKVAPHAVPKVWQHTQRFSKTIGKAI
jgi:O-succinylbenzoic acid--CoA ligase